MSEVQKDLVNADNCEYRSFNFICLTIFSIGTLNAQHTALNENKDISILESIWFGNRKKHFTLIESFLYQINSIVK